MKIFDRYIIVSIAGAFLFGIAMFMALLLAMDLLKDLIDLIAEKGVPAGIALQIFAYRIPSMLAYAFPMSMLLSILMVFNRMSSESEMVAIRAAGVSFLRIIVPALVFALLVTGFTYWLSDMFAPYAGAQAAHLTQQALKTIKRGNPVMYQRVEKQNIVYSIEAADLDIEHMRMYKVSLIYWSGGEPFVYIYAKTADWDAQKGHWRFQEAVPHYVRPGVPAGILMMPTGAQSQLDLEAYALKLEESPFDLAAAKKDPTELTANEIRAYVIHLQKIGDLQRSSKAQMWLTQRFAMPFSCLVFALIGAPLGLRHHRTSNAVGLGISLLVIFSYYFINVYLKTFGESGRMDPYLAAWLPNILGAILGVGLIFKANK